MARFSKAVKKMVGLRSGRITKNWLYDSKTSLLVPPLTADITGDGIPEILFGTSKGEFIVLNAQAQEIWRYNIHEELGAVEEMFLDQDVMNSINALPAVADLYNKKQHHIIFGSEMGVLYCLDNQGKLVWKYKTNSGIRGAPLIADVNKDGKLEIVFGTTDKFIYILTNEGKLIERFEQEAPVESTPGFFNETIYFGTNDGELIAMSAAGEKKWSYKTKGKITAAPAFSKLKGDDVDYLVIGSEDNNLYCLDIDGELIWTYETRGAIYSKAAIADINNDKKQEIIIGSCDNNIHAIHHDGEKFWSYETDFWVVATPLIEDIDGDGKLEVIAGSYDHNIYVLDSQGAYVLDYVPGLSGVVQQAGHYSEIMTQEPGQHIGKKIWQFKTEGVVIGCAQLGQGKGLVITTKKGIVDGFSHQD